MDKSWMGTNRTNKSYVDGVAAFVDYAVHNLQKMGNIDPRVNKQHLLMPCPCTKCLNHIDHKVEEVQFHLFRNGINLSYTNWTKHGEKDEPSISAPKPVNATTKFVDDTNFASDIPIDGPATVEMVNATKDNFDEDDLVKFQELLLDAEKPLYEGCPDFTKLSAIVKLLNLKEKNVARESPSGTLLHVPGKTKDGVNARLDLAELGVKPELFAMQEEDKTTLPPAGYTLTNAKKDTFCETLHNIRVPQGYCSNFSSLVNLKDRKLIGLKSHDYHMLMQEFLPIAIRSIMHPPTRYAIIRFCFFFKSICSKEIILQELDKMQAELVVTLCLLEKFFPLSFFDIMIHLTVHLTREVKLCGPICFRWMYPFERCMKVIKGHVRNRNKPEGCIAEETIAEETIEFFSEYHKSMETIGIPPDKHETDENEEGKPLSAGKSSEVSAELFQKAHLYVIQNTDEIIPYIERHKQVLKTENPGKRVAFLENEHSKSFAKWLRKEVERELAISKESVSKTVRASGVKRDTLGYTFVDLNNLGHKVDPFILASQARQVFYVKDQIDKKLSIVFKTPPKNYKDTYDEVNEEFSTVIYQRNDNILPRVNQRDLGNESRDDYYRTDCREIIVVNLDSSSDNNNSDSYSTSQISTSEEIDYDSPEPPKSLLKWYHYLSDEYKDNGRFWGSKSGCNESDVKPSWKDIEKAKACMLAKAQASEASSKAKVEACGSKVKVEACGSKAKLQASTKTLIVKSPVPITNCILGLANAKTWDAIKGKTFGVQIPPTMTFAEVKIGKRNLRKIIEISSDSSEDRKGASKATAPIFYGPSTQGLLDAYGYNIIEEYLSWNYFPSTNNESTDKETTDKRNTDKDCIINSNSTMFKGKYVPVCKKHKPNMYSHVPVTGSVLGLPNVTTCDEIEKKMGARRSKTCADKAKGKRKVSCGS
ncbi:putative transposase-associated domain-containing protein [Tanacetum coccineum]